MSWNDLQFFNPFAEIIQTANLLPRWQQPGATYFITFRLGDSIPATLRRQWETEHEQWRLHHPQPWSAEAEYHTRFSEQIDQWLDAGHGLCLLHDPSTRQIVENSLRHFEGDQHFHHSCVIKPNHVHCLTTLAPAARLEKLIKSWKGFSATSINKHLARTGPLWQEDYFDRLIRDADHFANCTRYIRRNPTKAGLKACAFTHFESDFAKRL